MCQDQAGHGYEKHTQASHPATDVVTASTPLEQRVTPTLVPVEASNEEETSEEEPSASTLDLFNAVQRELANMMAQHRMNQQLSRTPSSLEVEVMAFLLPRLSGISAICRYLHQVCSQHRSSNSFSTYFAQELTSTDTSSYFRDMAMAATAHQKTRDPWMHGRHSLLGVHTLAVCLSITT